LTDIYLRFEIPILIRITRSRYYTLPVVFPFGSGMGYHQSDVTCTLAPPYMVQCKVAHLSGPAGDEVAQLYHVPPSGLIVDHPLPIKRLIGFERIHLPAGSTLVSVSFNLTTEDFRLTDKAGGQSLYPGNHILQIWLGHGAPANISVAIKFDEPQATVGAKSDDEGASRRPLFGYKPTTCPPQADFAGRRKVVLGWARQLLNNSIDAGGSYGARAFLRDTNTFIDIALDTTDPKLIHPFVLGLFAGQHKNGDAGTCCVDFNTTTREPFPACPLDTPPYSQDPKNCIKNAFQTPFAKADVTTDAEASLVSTVFKYVRNTGRATILDERVVSQQDPVSRTVRERLGMLLNYLGNSSGRFHEGYGLIWGGTCADWGDKQQGMHATHLPYPESYGPTNMVSALLY
jgi:hypothetical protein